MLLRDAVIDEGGDVVDGKRLVTNIFDLRIRTHHSGGIVKRIMQMGIDRTVREIHRQRLSGGRALQLMRDVAQLTSRRAQRMPRGMVVIDIATIAV